MENLVYLDNAATTKPLKEALIKAQVYNEELFYNPSALYKMGVQNKTELTSIKETFKSIIGQNFDVIFTSCGSESDNTAIFSYSLRGNQVTSLGEHSAVHNPFLQLKNKGSDVRFAKLNKDGSVNVENLLSLVDQNTTFVSIVHVNNETGAINDINKIAKLVKEKNPKIIFHSDGVQAFMKIPYKLSLDVDLYSVSAHKINGLKGVGALFKNKKLNNLKPLIYGGGQENGLRSGTENLYGIKVFELALKRHNDTLQDDFNKISALKKMFIDNLDKNLFEIIGQDNVSPYVLTMSAIGLRGEVLQHKLEEDNIIIGTGSACSSKIKHSRMLKDIGYSDKFLDGVIRISFSFETTKDDVLYAVNKLNERALELKKVMYNK